MNDDSKKSIIIIGGGPSAMMMACTLNPNLFDVTIVEKGKAIGRKFLVAGKGGFNLTHSEDINEMLQKYEAPTSILNAIQSFNNNDLRKWLSSIGIETYVGSSKRVFPVQGIKPIEVLQAVKKEMDKLGVTLITETEWIGDLISDGYITLLQKGKSINIKADHVVFALGGGSWKVTGSDGKWLDKFDQLGIQTKSFQPSNCVMLVDWKESIKIHYGKPIKNIALSYSTHYKKGELLITEKGIEGSPAYALSYYVGTELMKGKSASVHIDLKPAFTLEKIQNTISSSNRKTTEILRKDLAFSSAAIAILKSRTSREEFNNAKSLSQKIKSLAVTINGLGQLDEAISTVCGIDPKAINDHFELAKYPNHYTIGEMIDWNAPTGGYLLQACFSMGWYLAKRLNGQT